MVIKKHMFIIATNAKNRSCKLGSYFQSAIVEESEKFQRWTMEIETWVMGLEFIADLLVIATYSHRSLTARPWTKMMQTEDKPFILGHFVTFQGLKLLLNFRSLPFGTDRFWNSECPFWWNQAKGWSSEPVGEVVWCSGWAL